MFSILDIELNQPQRKELAKALFNAGNLGFASLILSPVVTGKIDFSILLLGLFCFVFFFLSAILLLDERSCA